MKERITLTIDPAVARQAKRVAKARNTSLSSLVERLLDDAVDSNRRVKIAPFSERWGNKLKVAAKEEPRFKRLAEKYNLK